MRKTYSSEFKAKLVMEVLRGERLLNEYSRLYGFFRKYAVRIFAEEPKRSEYTIMESF